MGRLLISGEIIASVACDVRPERRHAIVVDGDRLPSATCNLIIDGMRIDIVTLFPEVFEGYLGTSILGRAQEAGLLDVRVHSLRAYATDRHRVTDEPPYGGGGGMVLKPGPLFRAVEGIMADSGPQTADGGSDAKGEGRQLRRVTADREREADTDLAAGAGVERAERARSTNVPVILLSPQGRPLTHEVARELAQEAQIILICGRYEGVDERVREHLVTDEISIGDYVMTGGELAAMVVVDVAARFLPGVLGDDEAVDSDSFADGLLEGPHYTRPATFRAWSVPDVLRSGHAAHIMRWRREQALRRTWERRPDLLLGANLTPEDRYFLATLALERVAEMDEA